MAMIPRKGGAPAPAPETTTAAAAAAPKPTETVTAAPAVATPVASPAPAALPAVAAPSAMVTPPVARKQRDAIQQVFERKIELEWNTLHRIQANQGNFLDLELNKQAFGNEIIVQLMSYQPSWQISPGTDDPDDVKYVRYSNDGITTTEGDNCMDYLAALKDANYDKAKMAARYQMAFVIEATPGDPSERMVGKIVQIDMSETSKKSFDQFRLENSYKESRGMITPDVAESGRLRLKTVVKTQKNFSWTVIQFENFLG